jgi:hypothetical protein
MLADLRRRAGAEGRPALALDHWSGSPELAAVYAEAGYAEVGSFTIEQRGEPWAGTVRVCPLGG